MKIKEYFKDNLSYDEACELRNKIIQEASIDDITRSCVLFTTESTVMLPMLINIINLVPLNESQLNNMITQLSEFKNVCIKENYFSDNNHIQKYDTLLETLNGLNSEAEHVYSDRFKLLEGAVKCTSISDGERMMNEIDKCILNLPDEYQYGKIKDLINGIDDSAFVTHIGDLIRRSYVIGLYNNNGSESQYNDFMPTLLGDKIKSLIYVDSPKISAMKSMIINEKYRFLNCNKGDENAIIDITEKLLKAIDVPELVKESFNLLEDEKSVLLKGQLEFSNICESISDIQLEIVLSNICILSNQYQVINEGKLTDVAVKTANKAEKGVTKTVHGAKDVGRAVKKVGKAVGDIPKALENEISNFVNKLIESDKERRKERLLNKGVRVKLFRFIRKCVTGGALAAVFGPMTAAITVVGSFAADKHLDAKVRREVLREMQQELKIVEEKIDDAKSSGDNKSKYQLMRTKDKLENEIARARYGLTK